MARVNSRTLGSAGLAVLVVVALVLWMLSGEVRVAEEQAPEPQARAEQPAPRVEVKALQNQAYQPALSIQGQVQPWRTVTILAQVDGTVEALPLPQGSQVKQGTPLLRLSADDRPAQALEVEAKVRQIEAELAAVERLRSDNLASQTEKLRLESELAAARADLSRVRLVSGHLAPPAPFDGVINRRLVELGEYVQPGQPLMELVQVDRLKVSGYAPQQTVARLGEGQPVEVALLDGRSLEGTLSFVASAADAATRSFRVEAEVGNPERLRVAGASATLRVLLPEQPAMFLSPAYLQLGDDGRLGVRHVDADNRVAFSPVELLSATTEGAWITGLPDATRLITLGGGFVSPGQTVEPVARDQ